MSYTDWPGLSLTWDRIGKNLQAYNCDSAETGLANRNLERGQYGISNSSFSTWDLNSVGINLFDGAWHTLVIMWSMDDDSVSYPSYGSDKSGLSALRKMVLVLDGKIIGNQTTWPGKQTPMSFIWDAVNGKSTFWHWGAGQPAGYDSATSINQISQVDSVFDGYIKRICVWDRPLGPNTDTNIHITNGADYSEGFYIGIPGKVYPSLLNSSYLFGYGTAEGTPGADSLWDPISGTYFRALSSNVIAYYKFDEQGPTNSITAQDWAGSAAPVGAGSISGVQKNPASGNTMSFFGAQLVPGTYTLFDSFDVDSSDQIYRSGSITFEDENRIQRRVGTILYDLGMVVFDSEYQPSAFSLSGLPLLSSLGTSGRVWGMSFERTLSAGSLTSSLTAGAGASANFWIQNLYFTSQIDIQRMVINVTLSGNEGNITQNPTGIDQTTGDFILGEQIAYPTSIGLYNDFNELVAIAKMNSPIKKDADHDVVGQVFLDF